MDTVQVERIGIYGWDRMTTTIQIRLSHDLLIQSHD